MLENAFIKPNLGKIEAKRKFKWFENDYL